MPVRPILILSSWGAGSSAVSGFFGECGAHLCPPFLESTTPQISKSYESQFFAGMCLATINEWTFEPRVDKSIFKNGFKSWYLKEVEEANQNSAHRIVLKNPLAAFLLSEITEVVDPIFVVVTRPFDKIEETKVLQKWPDNQGRIGAQAIYDQIYSFLHENNKTFFTISITDFMNSENARLKLLDYCDLDVADSTAKVAFAKIIQR